MSALQTDVDRRVQARVRVSCSGRLQLESGESVSIIACDVSTTGMRLVSREEPGSVSKGDHVRVRIMLKERFVTLPAVVAWTRKNADVWTAGVRVISKEVDRASRGGWDELTVTGEK